MSLSPWKADWKGGKSEPLETFAKLLDHASPEASMIYHGAF